MVFVTKQDKIRKLIRIKSWKYS